MAERIGYCIQHRPCYLMVHCGNARSEKQLRCCGCNVLCVHKAYATTWENCKYGALSDYHRSQLWERVCDDVPENYDEMRLVEYIDRAELENADTDMTQVCDRINNYAVDDDES